MVTIPDKKYKHFQVLEAWVISLQNSGVDNWSDIDEAYTYLEENYPEGYRDLI